MIVRWIFLKKERLFTEIEVTLVQLQKDMMQLCKGECEGILLVLGAK